MTQSTFNAEAFLATSIEATLDTKAIPVPEGEYPALIKKMTPRQLDDGRIVVDLLWEIDDPTVREATGQANPAVRQSLWIDVTPSGALSLAKGANVSLGQLRDAVKQNTGAPWNFGMLIGQVAKVNVRHTLDKRDDSIQAQIKSVKAL